MLSIKIDHYPGVAATGISSAYVPLAQWSLGVAGTPVVIQSSLLNQLTLGEVRELRRFAEALIKLTDPSCDVESIEIPTVVVQAPVVATPVLAPGPGDLVIGGTTVKTLP